VSKTDVRGTLRARGRPAAGAPRSDVVTNVFSAAHAMLRSKAKKDRSLLAFFAMVPAFMGAACGPGRCILQGDCILAGRQVRARCSAAAKAEGCRFATWARATQCPISRRHGSPPRHGAPFGRSLRIHRRGGRCRGWRARARESRGALPQDAFYVLREGDKASAVDGLRRHNDARSHSRRTRNPRDVSRYLVLITMNMAAAAVRLTVEECLAGVTRNAAHALGPPGHFGDGSKAGQAVAILAIWDIVRPARNRFYRIRFNPCTKRVWEAADDHHARGCRSASRGWRSGSPHGRGPFSLDSAELPRAGARRGFAVDRLSGRRKSRLRDQSTGLRESLRACGHAADELGSGSNAKHRDVACGGPVGAPMVAAKTCRL